MIYSKTQWHKWLLLLALTAPAACGDDDEGSQDNPSTADGGVDTAGRPSGSAGRPAAGTSGGRAGSSAPRAGAPSRGEAGSGDDGDEPRAGRAGGSAGRAAAGSGGSSAGRGGAGGAAGSTSSVAGSGGSSAGSGGSNAAGSGGSSAGSGGSSGASAGSGGSRAGTGGMGGASGATAGAGGSGVQTLTDAQVASVLLTINQGEITVSQIAVTRGQTVRVRTYAQELVTEHTAAQVRENDLFEDRMITPADNSVSMMLQSEAAATVSELQAASDEDFDTTFISGVIAAHENVLALIDGQLLPSAMDDDLREELVAFRIAVDRHRVEAIEISERLDAGDLPNTPETPGNP
jgi:predicted outer membrane protein